MYGTVLLGGLRRSAVARVSSYWQCLQILVISTAHLTPSQDPSTFRQVLGPPFYFWFLILFVFCGRAL